jgi:hypothetical protein
MSSVRLSPLNSAWLFTESRATPNHVGGLLPSCLRFLAPLGEWVQKRPFKNTIPTRAEFEERMQIVREQLVQGKLKFNKGLRGPESLLKVRLLPNRRIDLMSIDESARLQGNMARQFIDGAFDDLLPGVAVENGI